MDDDWGTLVWLLMTTGVRRGELCGLRFSRIDFDEGVISLRTNWVNGKEKDTKTHQAAESRSTRKRWSCCENSANE